MRHDRLSDQELVGIGFLITWNNQARIESKLDQLLQGATTMAIDLTQLTTDVSADTDAVNSAVTLLTQLAAEITANANDPVALAALAASLETNTANLAAAVTQNTPAAPAA